jgi:hypothetical protein
MYLIEHRETGGDLLQTVSFESGHAAEECQADSLTVTHDAAARKK